MFGLLKTIIWIVGAVVVAGFVLNYFGYEINLKYFSQSKARCQEEIKKCSQNVIQKGTENANCDLSCVDPNLIIKKK